MVLVIDTSSACSGLALLSASGEVRGELVASSGPGFDIAGEVGKLVDPRRLERIVVAIGPGSFTGLRVGVAYALGLAMGLEVPLHTLGTLELAAARAWVPATGLSEAGRGRVYFKLPGEAGRAGTAGEVPHTCPATGWVKEATAAALAAAGVELLEEDRLKPFAEAAAGKLGAAREVGYDRVKLEYLHTFGSLL